MKQTTFTFPSTKEGLQLRAIEVRPDEEIRGVVVLVHGMAEHKERYLPFMEYLSTIGYASLIYDQIGHGESILEEGDLGYLYGNGEEIMPEDVHRAVQEAKKRFEGAKIHLLGHSMGSLIVRTYLQKYDDEITSLTVSGCVANNPAAGVGKLLATLTGKIKGIRYRSPLITQIAFGSYNKGFKDPKSTNAWLNSDESQVEIYDQDPLCGFIFTTDGYRALMELIHRCYDEKRYEKKHKNLPILFLSGSDDPCCSGEKGFHAAVDFLKGIGYESVSGVMLSGMRHEILNEPEKEKVYQLIAVHLGTAGMQ